MGLTFGNLEFQSKGSSLGFRKGWWERKNLDINLGGIAADQVAAANLKPKKNPRALLASVGSRMGQATLQFLKVLGTITCKVLDKFVNLRGVVPELIGARS